MELQCIKISVHFQLFLDHGASLNFLDSEGRSPLYLAISGYCNTHDSISQLLRWGADVNLHKHGRCPLLTSFYSMKHEVGNSYSFICLLIKRLEKSVMESMVPRRRDRSWQVRRWTQNIKDTLCMKVHEVGEFSPSWELLDGPWWVCHSAND